MLENDNDKKKKTTTTAHPIAHHIILIHSFIHFEWNTKWKKKQNVYRSIWIYFIPCPKYIFLKCKRNTNGNDVDNRTNSTV